MSIVYTLDGIELDPENVLLHWADEEGFEGVQAADGTGSFGSVTFHDPDGTLNVRGWMPFTIDETDCTSAPRLVTSWIWVRGYEMGDELTAAGRDITCQLLDPNAMLSLRIIGGTGGSRTDETDTTRLAWLLANDALDGLVTDTGYINPTGLPVDAASYYGKTPADVLMDLCGPRDRIFFAFWDQTATSIGLFFDDPTATTYTSTITISNVASDLSSTCFPPFDDAKLERDPSDVYCTIRVKYATSAIYRTNAATQATFFPSPLVRRSFQVENLNIGKLSTAINAANRILAQKATERDEITVTIRVPSTHVGLIDAGMRLGIRNTRWANEGYDPLAYTRVERRTFKQAEGRRGFYDVTLTLSNHGIGGGGGTGGGSTDPIPYVPPASTHYYEGSGIFELPDGTGGWFWAADPDAAAGSSTVSSTNQDGAIFQPDVTYTGEVHYAGVPGDAAIAFALDVVATYPPNGLTIGWADTGSTSWSGSFTVPTAGGGLGQFSAKAQLGGGGTTHLSTVSWWFDPEDWIPPELPDPGKPVEDETPTPDPDGVETVFTTAVPYAALSLHVTMNGSDLDSGVDFTETTSTTFTFTDPPPADAQIVVWYITGV